MEQSIIKVFTGQRRVGKSYLLFQIIQLIQKKNKKASIIYINKEDLNYLLICIPFFKIMNQIRKLIIFFKMEKLEIYREVETVKSLSISPLLKTCIGVPSRMALVKMNKAISGLPQGP